MTTSFPVRLLSRLVGRNEAHSSKSDEMRVCFNGSREDIGLLIDGVASLVGPENRNGPEAALLHQLQDAYKEARPS